MMTNNNIFLPLYVSIHDSIVRLRHISSSVVLTINKGAIYYIAGIQNVDIINLLCFFFIAWGLMNVWSYWEKWRIEKRNEESINK